MAEDNKVVGGSTRLFDGSAKLKQDSHTTTLRPRVSPTRSSENSIINKEDEVRKLKITHSP